MRARGGNIDAAIAQRYDMKECFRLLDVELEKLIFMREHWRTAYNERCRFLTVEDAKSILREYLSALRDNVNDRSRCHVTRRGVYWRRIRGQGKVTLWRTDCDDRDETAFAHVTTTRIAPSDWLLELNAKIDEALDLVEENGTYEEILKTLRNAVPRLDMGTYSDRNGHVRNWLPKTWRNVFKKQGAYYTLKSLVVGDRVKFASCLEHGGRATSDKVVPAKSQREGLIRLSTLSAPSVPAFVVHAILRKSMEVTGVTADSLLRDILG